MQFFKKIDLIDKIRNFLIYKKNILLKKKRENNFKKKLANFLKENSVLNKQSPLILIWDLGGFSRIFAKNSIFSIALNLRGYETHFVICDGVSFACIQRGIELNENFIDWRKRCDKCFRGMIQISEKYGVKYSITSDFITEEKLKEFKNKANSISLSEAYEYKFLDVPVGKLAWSSLNRYMKGRISDFFNINDEQKQIYREYFYAAIVNTFIASKIFEKYKPTGVLVSHGVYIDYAPPFVLAFNLGIPTICWSSGFNNFFHYFTVPKSKKKLNLRGCNDIDNANLFKTILDDKHNARINAFIDNRYFKQNAKDISFINSPKNKDLLRKSLKLFDVDRPIVALFAHVNWDYCFDLSNMIFDNANQWVIESIRKMIQLRDVYWLIRIHPGEKIDGSVYTTEDVLKNEFKILPEHIKILGLDVDINSYGLYQLIDVGITIFGTVGVELPLFGKPIIAAGDAHFSGKGFTLDSKNKEEYFKYLENIKDIKPLSAEQVKLARKYAYSYFIERQIPLTVINKAQGHWGDIDLNKLENLLPGRDPIIDKICDGIISGKDVILDENCLDYLEKMKEAEGL